MIHCVLIINNLGQPRLAKFYTPLEIHAQQALIKQIHAICLKRTPQQSNFLTLPELLRSSDGDEEKVQVIYRLYATLNFVFIVDEQESELGILDLIQVFVEALDKCFSNVCELDLVFGWEVLESVLEELIQGGMVLETNVNKIVSAVDDNNRQQHSGTQGIAQSQAVVNARRSMVGNTGIPWNVPLNEDAMAAASRAFSSATSVFRSYLPGGGG